MYRSCLLYGDSGSGKTVASLTAPKPITIVDVDCRARRMKGVDLTGVTIIDINEPLSQVSLTEIAKTAVGSMPKNPLKLCPQGYIKTVEEIEKIVNAPADKRPRTLVIDPLTRICEHLKRLICHVNNIPSMRPQDWGAYLHNLEELIGKVTMLTAWMNVVVIAHVTHEKDEASQSYRYIPHTQGQMENKLGSKFDEVYYMVVKETDAVKAIFSYQFMTRFAGNKYVARTSKGMNVPQYIPADLSDLDGTEMEVIM